MEVLKKSKEWYELVNARFEAYTTILKFILIILGVAFTGYKTFGNIFPSEDLTEIQDSIKTLDPTSDNEETDNRGPITPKKSVIKKHQTKVQYQPEKKVLVRR